MSKEQDQIFFRNFSLVLGLIVVMMVTFFVIARLVATDDEAEARMRAAKVAKLTEPVGQVVIAGATVADDRVAASDGAATSDMGKTVYDGVCANCHSIPALAAMIPQTGDAAAWEARMEKGMATLYANAINGFVGEMGMMPARGSNPELTDDEVKAAVDYIVGQLDTATNASLDTSTSASVDAAPAADNAPGKAVYDGLCANCHGIAALASMVPQTGTAAAWEARIEKGMATLYANAINGIVGEMGMMPARGGNPELTDDDVKAAVDYMIKQIQ